MVLTVNQDFQDYLVKQSLDPVGAVAEVFVFAADTRRSMQTTTFGWGVSYSEWMFSTELWKMEDSDQNMPLHMMMALSIPLAFLPSSFVTLAPYFNPYSAAVAAVLDAFNIYRYFD